MRLAEKLDWKGLIYFAPNVFKAYNSSEFGSGTNFLSTLQVRPSVMLREVKKRAYKLKVASQVTSNSFHNQNSSRVHLVKKDGQ
jgi:hypothetical protein